MGLRGGKENYGLGEESTGGAYFLKDQWGQTRVIVM